MRKLTQEGKIVIFQTIAISKIVSQSFINVFINHILLIFKLSVYKSREKKLININNLIAEIWKVKIIEKQIALTNSKKIIAFTKKWHITNNIVP